MKTLIKALDKYLETDFPTIIGGICLFITFAFWIVLAIVRIIASFE